MCSRRRATSPEACGSLMTPGAGSNQKRNGSERHSSEQEGRQHERKGRRARHRRRVNHALNAWRPESWTATALESNTLQRSLQHSLTGMGCGGGGYGDKQRRRSANWERGHAGRRMHTVNTSSNSRGGRSSVSTAVVDERRSECQTVPDEEFAHHLHLSRVGGTGGKTRGGRLCPAQSGHRAEGERTEWWEVTVPTTGVFRAETRQREEAQSKEGRTRWQLVSRKGWTRRQCNAIGWPPQQHGSSRDPGAYDKRGGGRSRGELRSTVGVGKM